MTKTELAETYVTKYINLSKEKGIKFSKKSIATIMYEENKDVFKDSEDARSSVRYVLGSIGVSSQRNKFSYLKEQFDMMDEPVIELKNTEPYIFPKDIKKVLVVNDIHGNFYDAKALEIALDYGINQGCDSLFINGDFLDFYQESKFDKDPSISARMNEREWGVDFLKMSQGLFNHVVLKEGNHDKRLMDYINRKLAGSPELIGMLGNYQDYLFFDGCKVQFIEDYRHVKLGKLNAIHGHEYNGFGGGVNVARNRFMKTLDNTISGHSHVCKSDMFKTVNDEYYGSWTVGCLCQLNARYAPKNNWQHGFAVVTVDSDGDFDVNNRMIIKNKSISA